MCVVLLIALRLAQRHIGPIQAQPVQIGLQRSDKVLLGARAVAVFDAQQKAPSWRVQRLQSIEQSGTHIAQVQFTGRAGCKTGYDGSG